MHAFAEQKYPVLGLAVEYLGSTTAGFGLNIICSPNQFSDLGIGTSQGTFLDMPELHAFVRFNLLDFELAPFLMGSVSVFNQRFADYSSFPIHARVHAGIRWQAKAGFCLGASVGTSFLDNEDFYIAKVWNYPVIPGASIGWTFY